MGNVTLLANKIIAFTYTVYPISLTLSSEGIDWRAIIWTNVGMLLIGPWGTNFKEILIRIKYSLYDGRHFVSATIVGYKRISHDDIIVRDNGVTMARLASLDTTIRARITMLIWGFRPDLRDTLGSKTAEKGRIRASTSASKGLLIVSTWKMSVLSFWFVAASLHYTKMTVDLRYVSIHILKVALLMWGWGWRIQWFAFGFNRSQHCAKPQHCEKRVHISRDIFSVFLVCSATAWHCSRLNSWHIIW